MPIATPSPIRNNWMQNWDEQGGQAKIKYMDGEEIVYDSIKDYDSVRFSAMLGDDLIVSTHDSVLGGEWLLNL